MSPPRAIPRLLAAGLAACLATGAAGRPAQAVDLPARNQALLLLRVLVYDRNLKGRAGDAVRVAVVYRSGDASSEAERDALMAAYQEVAREVVAQGLPVKVEALAWRDAADFAARLGQRRFAAVHAGRGLAAVVEELARAARKSQSLTFAPAREMVSAGLAVGLVFRGDRAGLVVNLGAARAEGAELDPALLQLAEVLP